MKKIFLIAFLIPTICFSQIDTSSVRISGLIFKGRDVDIVGAMVKNESDRFSTIDSTIKIIYVSPPGSNVDVTFNSIPGKEWLRMIRKISQNVICLNADNNVWKRMSDEMRLHGSAWLIHKLDLDKADADKIYDDLKKSGQKYAKKQDDLID